MCGGREAVHEGGVLKSAGAESGAGLGPVRGQGEEGLSGGGKRFMRAES